MSEPLDLDELSEQVALAIETGSRSPEHDGCNTNISALLAQVRALREALEASRIPHLRVDGDPWFNCDVAKREDSDDPTDYSDARCDCGADAHNARIDAALGGPER